MFAEKKMNKEMNGWERRPFYLHRDVFGSLEADDVVMVVARVHTDSHDFTGLFQQPLWSEGQMPSSSPMYAWRYWVAIILRTKTTHGLCKICLEFKFCAFAILWEMLLISNCKIRNGKYGPSFCPEMKDNCKNTLFSAWHMHLPRTWISVHLPFS